MRWSWRLGSVAGIAVHLHATFALLVGAIAAFQLVTNPFPLAVFNVALLVALFASVLLHELGHAFTARAFGIRTREITLLPIGGVARLERMPREPAHEFLVAIAGPAVNVVLAFVLVPAFFVAGGTLEELFAVPLLGAPVGVGLPALLASLACMNLTLGAFNLLPAYPLDGGRLLRAVLGNFTTHARATRIA
ncbi:MAG TPA: site-2 protease family protein, partial [Planctomycetota bacterium]|nr:site-2 protease family protein [Planctomycetota bacterium]